MTNETDGNLRFLREAIRLAEEGSQRGDGGPFGAVVVRDGEIVGRGWNRVTSRNDPTAHAEIEAIRDACRTLGTFDLSGCEIHASCEPCPMCLAAIYWARLNALHYAATRDDAAAVGFDDEFFYRQVNLSPAERTLPHRQALRDEAVRVLGDWAASPDRIPY